MKKQNQQSKMVFCENKRGNLVGKIEESLDMYFIWEVYGEKKKKSSHGRNHFSSDRKRSQDSENYILMAKKKI